jgi:hypothetical protein
MTPQDGKGRVLPLTAEAQEALQEIRKAFVDKFGREPGPNDPILFDPDEDEPTPLSATKLEAATIKAMHASGFPPEHIYAYKKTGMLLTPANYDQWSEEDLAEYQGALQEYYQT